MSSNQDLRSFLKSVCCMTTDLGVESSIGDAPNVDLCQLLTQFCDVGYADAELDIVPPDVDDNGGGVYLMEDCLSVAGTCHILHNATEDLCSYLQHFKWFFEPFRACVHLLKKREFRKAFVHACLDDEAARFLAPRMSHFTATLVGHRWGYLIAACQAVSDLESVLRLRWATDKLCGRFAPAQAQPNAGVGDPSDPIITNDSIRIAAVFVFSPERWAYMQMLLQLAAVINCLEAFFKSCPCHPSSIFNLRGESWSRRHKAFLDTLSLPNAGMLMGSCPMQGCQAPSMAAGKHWSVMESWFADGNEKLLLLCAGFAIGSLSGHIMSDWQSGRMKLCEILKRKLSFTDVIPFKLAGIVHGDAHVGRRVAQECLQQFASGAGTEASANPLHHRLSMKFLHRDSPFYPMLMQFVDGTAALQDPELKPLWTQLCSFKFVRMAEQSVERIHALGKLNIKKAPHHAEAYWSLGLRMPLIEHHLQIAPNFVNQLGKCCDSVTTPIKLATSFRLLVKSVIREAFEEHVPPQKIMEILRPMVYRCDDSAQMACLAAVAKHTSDSRTRLVAKLRPITQSPLQVVSPLGVLLHPLVTDHFRMLCQGSQIFSSTCFPDCSVLASLSARLQPIKHCDSGDAFYQHIDDFVPDDDLVLQSARCDVDASGSNESGRHIFFKVLSPRPSLMKGIAYGSGICQGFASDEVAIVLLRAIISHNGQHTWLSDLECSMEQGSLRNQTVLAVPLLEHAELRKCLFQWHVASQAFMLDPLPSGMLRDACCDSLIQDMLKARALPKPCHASMPYVCVRIDEARHNCLKALQVDGLVGCVAESLDSTSWMFTSKGAVRLRVCCKVMSPEPCLVSSGSMADFSSWSTYSLLDYLLTSGWQVKWCTTAAHLKRAPPHIKDSDRFVYVKKQGQ